MAKIGVDISEAVNLLKDSKLVAIPTETVYGLAGNAFDLEAVTEIFKAKNRPFFDPLILHTDTIEKVLTFVTEIPEVLQKLADVFWPGPLTLLLDRTALVPDLITSGLDTVAVRIPSHPLTLSLLAKLDFPLAAPSANPFGYISPTSAAHVQAQLGDKIDYILDGGICEVGLESTIVGLENGVPVILRLGGLSVEKIEKVIGKVEIKAHSSSNPKAPGMLKSHYSPRKPFMISPSENDLKSYNKNRVGVLVFGEFDKDYLIDNQVSLSMGKDIDEAAHKLFSSLRTLDTFDIDVIILKEYLPEIGLGLAMNDRLKRAAAI
jgi:L-threonylcarbamoyladenylate synthase